LQHVAIDINDNVPPAAYDGLDITNGKDDNGGRLKNTFEGLQNSIVTFSRENSAAIKTSILVVMVMAYSAYFAYALYYEFGSEASIRLLWVTMTVATCFAICIIQDHCGDSINKHLIEPFTKFIMKHWRLFKW